MIRRSSLAAVTLALILTACASPAKRDAMTPPDIATARHHPYTLHVQTGGGSDTGAMESSNIADADLKAAIEDAVPLMVHEATVNALKHAQPSRVAVDVDAGNGRLTIAVTDDGRGFPFKGRYNHDTLAGSPTAPRTLFDRVSALGGRLSVESSDRGSRVEMQLSY